MCAQYIPKIRTPNMMPLTLEKTPLLLGLSGGVSISAAIVAMNTLPGKNMQMASGMPLFTLGWVLIIMGFFKNGTRAHKYRSILAVASVGVYAAAMMSRMLMDAGKTGAPMHASKMLFLVCWLVVGLLMGMKKHVDDTVEPVEITEEGGTHNEVHSPLIHGLGFVPPALIVLSMMSVNNMERPRGMASGPGMPLFMLAWVILSLVNSVRVDAM